MDALLNSLFQSDSWISIVAGVVMLFIIQKAGGESFNLSGFLKNVFDRIRGVKPVEPANPEPNTPSTGFPVIDKILEFLKQKLVAQELAATQSVSSEQERQVLDRALAVLHESYPDK